MSHVIRTMLGSWGFHVRHFQVVCINSWLSTAHPHHVTVDWWNIFPNAHLLLLKMEMMLDECMDYNILDKIWTCKWNFNSFSLKCRPLSRNNSSTYWGPSYTSCKDQCRLNGDTFTAWFVLTRLVRVGLCIYSPAVRVLQPVHWFRDVGSFGSICLLLMRFYCSSGDIDFTGVCPTSVQHPSLITKVSKRNTS